MIQDLEACTREFVSGAIEKLMDLPDPVVVTCRTGVEYRAAHPKLSFPVWWYRAVVAHIA